MYKTREIAPELIAEVVTQGPDGYRAHRSWEELFNIANGYGDYIAVNVDPLWGGTIGRLQQARAFTSKPLVAKGVFHTDAEIQEARDAGADHVIVTGRVPEYPYGAYCWVDPVTPGMLKRLPLTKFDVVVADGQNLYDGSAQPDMYDAVVTRMADETDYPHIVQADVRFQADIKPETTMVMVGRYLEEYTRGLSTAA